MSTRAIVPVTLSLTQGDFCTLWAPAWKENGTQWQAFLGDETSVLVFDSPAHMLAFLDSGLPHDLVDHPQWAQFNAQGDDRVVPDDRNFYDVVGAPAYLAGRPSHENVSKLAKVFQISRSLADVASANEAQIFFASHSVLGNVARGSEHYAGENGLEEWSGVGRAVLANWAEVVHSLDASVRIVDEASFSEGEVAAAEERIAAAQSARAAQAEKAKEEAQRRAANADPYDGSAWFNAGIDPVKITMQGTSVYTLRTYLGTAPVFLGKYGEIFTFPSSKQLLRWIVENDDHELAEVSTWPDLVNLANAGELEITVHPDNAYSFNGIAADIEKGPDAVDTAQMAKAYELLADAADWAKDDSLNSLLLANPRMQDYLAYMLGSTEASGYVPTAPFTDKAQTWKDMEDQLIKRFSKF
ncbi:hypothetical protein ACUY28_03700 [Corynebacterium sanguinis]|uniref:hypothetical protein n=1 Tax=Corynebacterium TaxID=1716 RepID=UPI0010AA6BA1|nr:MULTISPECIES: hypothetical protein [Corynebacterium]MCT1412830.1 hypothetical protein [Corynebacterium sanguinis]MCT1413787.1 hypothetical protein [Corynebacterium sanguinis]MCT1554639.1 hypothetical protein [Corynebacterium sanguinis]MCT1584278.1 hypothetical protein [Corynebacterium sanguinis]MCT1597838.1 hypothetical protein [Corynebacterium sanguinis]